VNLLPAGVVQERGTKKKHVSLTCDGSACLETDQCAQVGGCVVEEEEEGEGRITSVLRLTEEASAIQIQNPNQLGEPDRRMRKNTLPEGGGHSRSRITDRAAGRHCFSAADFGDRAAHGTRFRPDWEGDGSNMHRDLDPPARLGAATVGRRQDQHCWELGWSLRAPPEHKT
jgi:hypothetical protein